MKKIDKFRGQSYNKSVPIEVFLIGKDKCK